MEPRLGLATDYSSNPELRSDAASAENHAAILLNVPVRYDLESVHFGLSPSARYSDTRGYSSLASNFLRLDTSLQFVNELGSLQLTGAFARDSSLYHGGESAQGVGVRRDTRSAGMHWERATTSRINLEFAVNWSRVQYDEGAQFTNLTDYRYVSAAPSVSYALTERNTVSVLGSAGRYNSLDNITGSKDYNLQLSIARQLSENWDLATSAGYSKSKNTRQYYFGPFYLGAVESDQNGAVYSASLKRRGESVFFTATASRALRPSGFAFLSRQDVAEAQLNYQYSEKWTFSAGGSFHKTVDPLTTGGALGRRYFVTQFSADWHWTPEWLVTLRASRITQRFDEVRFNAQSTGASLEMTRQFHRRQL